jgi:hypothetical protein
MWQYVVKFALSAAIVVAVSEISKRSSRWGAALASLPLTSLLAFVWLYLETRAPQRVADLSFGVFWLVLPSLPLFVVLTLLLRAGYGFWTGLAVACATTVATYAGMLWALEKIGIKL